MLWTDYLTLPYLTIPYHTIPYLTLPYLTSILHPTSDYQVQLMVLHFVTVPLYSIEQQSIIPHNPPYLVHSYRCYYFELSSYYFLESAPSARLFTEVARLASIIIL